MPSQSKPDLSVSALLRTLNKELDLKVQTEDDRSSVRRRLGPRLKNQDVQVSQGRAKGELCGAIFMCNRRTWKECLGQSLFGLPIAKKSLVEQVVPGMKLFLFEYERRQLWGVFEATSYGGMNIISDAYSGGSFPCQVRVKVPEDCVALYEEEFYHVIKKNYYTAKNFNFNLTRNQVCQLVNLFERKYLRAKGMEPGLAEYEDNQCIRERSHPMELLLTNEEAQVYPEDLNMTSLAHNLYASGRQILQDGSFFDSEGVGFVYRNIQQYTGHETRNFVPLSNAIVQNNYLPLNVDVTRFRNIDGQLGDFGTGDVIPVSSTVKHEMIETVVIPGHASRLHSDRPTGKSVWSRLSGRLMVAEPSPNQVKLPENPAQPSPVLDGSVVADPASSPIESIQHECIADVSEKAEEECPVGFKRRRASNYNASANENETSAGKRRRKLTRPFFDASADVPLAEQVTNIAEESPLVHIDNSDYLQNKTPLEEQHLSKATFRDVSIALAPSCNEASIKTSGNSGDDAMLAENAPTKIDLNLPLESQTEGVVKLEQQTDHYDNISVGKMREAAACALTLSLCPQESEYVLPQGEKEAELNKNTQNRSVALDLVQDDSMPHSADVFENCVLSSKQVDKADAGLAADSSRANTLSLAPCTPAKELFGSSGPAMHEGQGLAVPSHDSMKEIPLKLDAILPDVEVQLDDNASRSTLSSSVDLKSILSGLQVSGIKLQLGSSPCLILQLGDSSSSAGNQETHTEMSLKPPPSDDDVLQRPSSR